MDAESEWKNMSPFESVREYQSGEDSPGRRSPISRRLRPPQVRSYTHVAFILFIGMFIGASLTSLGRPVAAPVVHKLELPLSYAPKPAIVPAVVPEVELEAPPANETAEVKPAQDSGCPKRPEWRDLKSSEQKEYISAVLCLRDLFSEVAPESNATAYDDFPSIYGQVGARTRDDAAFLPWHRQFLHIYEKSLKNMCGYRGRLPYWDWTLDFLAIEQSPVFDLFTGFGGDGETRTSIIAGKPESCLTLGPFAGIQVGEFDPNYTPHCLERKFQGLDGVPGHIDGSSVSPEAIEEILKSETYEQFAEQVQTWIQKKIPPGIGGDFGSITAPYDPLFFLHAAQIDRLWWLWQQRQPRRGILEYGGMLDQTKPDMKASLDDVLLFLNLDKDLKVKEVMNTAKMGMCYRY